MIYIGIRDWIKGVWEEEWLVAEREREDEWEIRDSYKKNGKWCHQGKDDRVEREKTADERPAVWIL